MKTFFLILTILTAILSALVHDTASARQVDEASANKVGICRVINRETEIYPVGSATTFMYDFVHPRNHTNFSVDSEGKSRTDTVVQIIELPTHGRLIPKTTASRDFRKYHYRYLADEGFVGTEHFVIRVTVEGIAVQMDYELNVNEDGVPTKNQSGNGYEPCPKDFWMKSLGDNVDGSNASGGADPHPEAEVMPFQLSNMTDERGFIDVWQLREDVMAVEALVAYEDYDEWCYYEGGPDDVLSATELARIEREEDECLAEGKRAFAIYTSARKAFNDVWLPVINEAIEKGDKVAEVIMRQCETTPVLIRDGIESTCGYNPEQFRKANERLKEIGFMPAVDLRDVLIDDRGNSSLQRAKNLAAIYEQFKSGALGHDRSFTAIGGNVANAATDLENYRISSVMEAITQDAPRAFTFSPGYSNAGWQTSAFTELRLNRKPLTPGYLTRGQLLHYGGGGSIYTGPNYWRFGPFNVYVGRNRSGHTVAGPNDSSFLTLRAQLLAEIESSIDSYLAEDPRWSVFLLHRVGHHEWVPEGTTSSTDKISEEWEGDWELQRAFEYEMYRDWKALNDPEGATTARIRRTDDSTHISFQSQDSPPSPIGDARDCQLRYSGGLTFIPSQSKRWSVSHETVLGYLSSEPLEGLAEVFKPFDPTKRYKQVIVLCPEGESLDSNRTRYLLLANDTMVEVASDRYAISHARHFRRVK